MCLCNNPAWVHFRNLLCLRLLEVTPNSYCTKDQLSDTGYSKETQSFRFGVPQGPFSGPLLFTILNKHIGFEP